MTAFWNPAERQKLELLPDYERPSFFSEKSIAQLGELQKKTSEVALQQIPPLSASYLKEWGNNYLVANDFLGDEFPPFQNKAMPDLDLEASASRASPRKYCLWDGTLAAEQDRNEGKTVFSGLAQSKNNSSSRSGRSHKVKRKGCFSFQKSLSLNPRPAGLPRSSWKDIAPVPIERERLPEDEMDFSVFGTEEKLVDALTAFFSRKLPTGKSIETIKEVSDFFFKNETAFERLCYFVLAMRGLSQDVSMWYSKGERYLFDKYCKQFKVKEETARFQVVGTREIEILAQEKKALKALIKGILDDGRQATLLSVSKAYDVPIGDLSNSLAYVQDRVAGVIRKKRSCYPSKDKWDFWDSFAKNNSQAITASRRQNKDDSNSD